MSASSVLRSYYTEIDDLKFFSNDSYAVCVGSGMLVLLDLSNLQAGQPAIFPIQRDVHCLEILSNVLLTADYNGNVSGYILSSLIDSMSDKNPLASSVFTENLVSSEINAIEEFDTSKFLIGCGNGDIQVHDVELPKLPIRKLFAHSKQVTGLAKKSEFVFVSCSSDSTVNVWDLRTSTPERTIQVGSNKEVLRPTFSNHINCIDVDNDFMVCGGGVELGLWHLPSSSLASLIAPKSSQIYYAVEIVEGGSFLVGGSGPSLSRYTYSGDLLLEIPVKNLYSVNVIRTMENNSSSATFIGGRSPEIHVLTNFGYISTSIKLPL